MNHIFKRVKTVLISSILMLFVLPTLAADTYTMTLKAPVTTWDEAIPLGNGMLGGLLWGRDNTINLSLDRGDLWDETTPPEMLEGNWNYANMRELITENYGEFMRRYSNVYNHLTPTKLPGGRLAITLGADKKATEFTLQMKSALGQVNFVDGSQLKCFFHATERVALMLVDETNVITKFIRPDGINQLKYKPAEFGAEGGTSWMVQEASEGLVYATVTASKRIGNQTLLAVTIASNLEDTAQRDPLNLAKSRVASALEKGYAKMFASHQAWWQEFWQISFVEVPDERIQRHYNLVKYFYGAASRPNAPSMPLQAVWTQDSGGLPPWKGDFHNDLNTQMTYLAYHKAGLADSGLSFINHMWDLLPQYRKFAKEFYGVEGAAIPTVMSLNGKPLGGWPQYSLSPTYAIWVGQSFYLHWKHSMDPKFLKERAYPWMDEIMTAIVQLLEERDGKLYLPLSSSAEIFDASPRAFLKPNSNQDLAMLQWSFEAMAEMAGALDKSEDEKKWKALRGKLNDLHVNDEDILMFSANEPFNQSHRHHSHIMAIHPFGTLNIDGSEQDRKIISASLAKVDELGTRAWTGYSFSWFACLLARAGQAELACQYLIWYERAFTLRNGFHVNGDQIGTGLSGFSYRPFTLEGNFLAMEAVHDMLLQSWPVNIAEDPTPVIRIFPAMPWQWHNASYHDLRAEGGFVVSAKRENNATTHLEIKATVDGELRLRDNFGGATPKFSREVKRQGRDFSVQLKAGQSLIGALPKPATIPPQPQPSVEAVARIQRVEELATIPKHKIQSTTIPLRIGADSAGNNRFIGDMARVSLFNRVLSAAEVAALAVKDGKKVTEINGCVFSYDFSSIPNKGCTVTGQPVLVEAANGLGKAMRFDGDTFLSIAHDKSLNCSSAVTIEAWIYPRTLGTRVLDKSIAGTSQGYMIDTYANAVRLISAADTSNPTTKQQLKINEWTHIAGTIDGESGETVIYINGKEAKL